MALAAGSTQPQASLSAGRPTIKVGQKQMPFSEVVGITSEFVTAETPPKVVVKPMPSVVVLKRHHTRDMTLWAWHQAGRAGKPDGVRDCSLVMLNMEGDAVISFFMPNARVAKLELADLRAGASSVLIEQVTFICDPISPTP